MSKVRNPLSDYAVLYRGINGNKDFITVVRQSPDKTEALRVAKARCRQNSDLTKYSTPEIRRIPNGQD